jgi:hypothetical protein
MPNKYFSLLTPDTAHFNGQHILADTGSAYNGYLVDIAGGTSGSIGVSTGSAIGIAYDLMTMVELPTSDELVANLGGDYCNFVDGDFYALVGPGNFVEGTVPDIDDVLYDNANGLLRHTTSASHKAVGKCYSHATIQRKDGSYTVARCRFDFTQLL